MNRARRDHWGQAPRRGRTALAVCGASFEQWPPRREQPDTRPGSVVWSACRGRNRRERASFRHRSGREARGAGGRVLLGGHMLTLSGRQFVLGRHPGKQHSPPSTLHARCNGLPPYRPPAHAASNPQGEQIAAEQRERKREPKARGRFGDELEDRAPDRSAKQKGHDTRLRAVHCGTHCPSAQRSHQRRVYPLFAVPPYLHDGCVHRRLAARSFLRARLRCRVFFPASRQVSEQ